MRGKPWASTATAQAVPYQHISKQLSMHPLLPYSGDFHRIVQAHKGLSLVHVSQNDSSKATVCNPFIGVPWRMLCGCNTLCNHHAPQRCPIPPPFLVLVLPSRSSRTEMFKCHLSNATWGNGQRSTFKHTNRSTTGSNTSPVFAPVPTKGEPRLSGMR